MKKYILECPDMSGQREIEIKLRVRDPSVARRLILDLDLSSVDHCVEVDHYFNHPCRDFRTTDEAIRLRKRECKSGRSYYVLTYKGPREEPGSPIKTRREIEVLLSQESWIGLFDLLSALGFIHVASFTKERELYENRFLKASLDNLYGVGLFIELEASRPESIGILENVITRAVETGIGEIVNKTYLEICLETQRCRTEIDLD